jgi:hypothetical protein
MSMKVSWMQHASPIEDAKSGILLSFFCTSYIWYRTGALSSFVTLSYETNPNT